MPTPVFMSAVAAVPNPSHENQYESSISKKHLTNYHMFQEMFDYGKLSLVSLNTLLT
jgi:hypothetical protein